MRNLKSIKSADPQYETDLFKDYYLGFFEDYVNTKTIFSEEKLNSFYEASVKLTINRVAQHFCETLLQCSVSVEDLEVYLEVYLKDSSNDKDLLMNKLFCLFCFSRAGTIHPCTTRISLAA